MTIRHGDGKIGGDQAVLVRHTELPTYPHQGEAIIQKRAIAILLSFGRAAAFAPVEIGKKALMAAIAGLEKRHAIGLAAILGGEDGEVG